MERRGEVKTMVGDCELDDMAGRVRRGKWAKVFFYLFVWQFQRNSITVLLGHLLSFSLSSFYVQIDFQIGG